MMPPTGEAATSTRITSMYTNHQQGNGSIYVDDNENDLQHLSVEQQLLYYKKKYEETQADFDEFQQSSSELEHEMETQLSHYEQRHRDLESRQLNLVQENEYLKSKLERLSVDSKSQIEALQAKLVEISELNAQLTNHIRDLEQSNDDLERAKRHLDATLSDFDSKLNEQIERNELLESEIGEKEELQSVVQRLKDEARDLRQELMIQQSHVNARPRLSSSTSTTTTPMGAGCTRSGARTSITPPKQQQLQQNGSLSFDSASLSSSPLHLSNTPPTALVKPTTQTSPLSSSNIAPPQPPTPSMPLLSASSRISALNIVSDLLRKVGALESKLASCRNIMPNRSNSLNSPGDTSTAATTPTASSSGPSKTPTESQKIETNV